MEDSFIFEKIEIINKGSGLIGRDLHHKKWNDRPFKNIYIITESN
jgi:hypothetical protein